MGTVLMHQVELHSHVLVETNSCDHPNILTTLPFALSVCVYA